MDSGGPKSEGTSSKEVVTGLRSQASSVGAMPGQWGAAGAGTGHSGLSHCCTKIHRPPKARHAT